MHSISLGMLLAYGLLALVLFLVLRTFVAPVRLLFTFAYYAVAGGLVLWVSNLILDPAGFHFALNPISALLAGYLGLPGLLLLAAVKIYII